MTILAAGHVNREGHGSMAAAAVIASVGGGAVWVDDAGDVFNAADFPSAIPPHHIVGAYPRKTKKSQITIDLRERAKELRNTKTKHRETRK